MCNCGSETVASIGFWTASGITDDTRAGAATMVIAQFGSTRGTNAGVAAGIAVHGRIRRRGDLSRAW
jgi:hypothetical protein